MSIGVVTFLKPPAFHESLVDRFHGKASICNSKNTVNECGIQCLALSHYKRCIWIFRQAPTPAEVPKIILDGRPEQTEGFEKLSKWIDEDCKKGFYFTYV